jgi:hypothetical protein
LETFDSVFRKLKEAEQIAEQTEKLTQNVTLEMENFDKLP